MMQGIRIFFLIISLLSGGLIYYEKTTVGLSILTIHIGAPCFIISSLIAVFITTTSKIKFVHKRLGGFIVWLISISLLICILFAFNKIRNLSPVLFSTKFYREEGMDVEFRENRTFKALNHDIMGGELTYGRYELADSLIILKDKLKFGMENMKDTLKISNEGIAFTMEKPWRINEGKMSFEYQETTEVDITNNTETTIDSLFIKTYTKAPISIVSVKPNQIIEYKFDMKNPYIDGEYQLSFKNKGRLNQHKNFLKGYPLETVETIIFKELRVDINLIFGNTISINYQ